MRPFSTSGVISSCFLVVAAWMLFDPFPPLPAIPAAANVRAEDVEWAPIRAEFQDPPTMRVAGFDQRCSECHKLFESRSETPANLLRHDDIVLEHGQNSRCLNCHSTKDRDKLVLHGEVEIGYDRVVELCAKCHGPTWRDWQHGMHGRTLGSWETGSSEQVRLRCTECHDPHAPAYAPVAPLPGPNTLRMGQRHHEAEGGSKRKVNPLLRWMASESSDEGASHEPTARPGSERSEAPAGPDEEQP